MKYQTLIQSLGVDLNQEFMVNQIKDGVFKFTKDGIMERRVDGSTFIPAPFSVMRYILDGEYTIKRIEVPIKGQLYYTFELYESGELVIVERAWNDTLIDYIRFKYRFVFHSKRDAEAYIPNATNIVYGLKYIVNDARMRDEKYAACIK